MYFVLKYANIQINEKTQIFSMQSLLISKLFFIMFLQNLLNDIFGWFKNICIMKGLRNTNHEIKIRLLNRQVNEILLSEIMSIYSKHTAKKKQFFLKWTVHLKLIKKSIFFKKY